ncbi:11986_t:CDS:1 [Cetraspora pellucida]|uniref:11986_t:CDS:1 n=1 Tax=Cetraspora pellucida TaxID=1433469 RepID=A0ACA9L9L6_9GLOM|nr:11986_t:CDS:1 [Cetraspora pellucida]
MEDFSDIIVNLCIKIHDDIQKGRPEEFDWEDIKNNYNRVDDKRQYIQDLESWVKKKPATIAKEGGCSINDVNSRRGTYFLLGNYLINENSNDVQYLKHPKPCY